MAFGAGQDTGQVARVEKLQNALSRGEDALATPPNQLRVANANPHQFAIGQKEAAA